MQAMVSGGVWALDLLYERYSRMLYSFAYKMVNDYHVAQDLTQEAFFAAWRHASLYASSAGTVRVWLLAIIHHRTIDYPRAQRRRAKVKEIPLEGDRAR